MGKPDHEALEAFLTANPRARLAQEEREDRKINEAVRHAVLDNRRLTDTNRKAYQRTIDQLFAGLTAERSARMEQQAELHALRSGFLADAIAQWQKIGWSPKCSSEARSISQGPCAGW